MVKKIEMGEGEGKKIVVYDQRSTGCCKDRKKEREKREKREQKTEEKGEKEKGGIRMDG